MLGSAAPAARPCCWPPEAAKPALSHPLTGCTACMSLSPPIPCSAVTKPTGQHVQASTKRCQYLLAIAHSQVRQTSSSYLHVHMPMSSATATSASLLCLLNHIPLRQTSLQLHGLTALKVMQVPVRTKLEQFFHRDG